MLHVLFIDTCNDPKCHSLPPPEHRNRHVHEQDSAWFHSLGLTMALILRPNTFLAKQTRRTEDLRDPAPESLMWKTLFLDPVMS